MVDLSAVMGTLLKGLANSRVTSDIYSRDVSLKYEEDPILRLFPVPRIEIKEVTISLPFTIKNIEQGPVQKDEIIKSIQKVEASKFADHLYSAVILKQKNREVLLTQINETQFKKNISKTLEKQLSLRVNYIEKALEGKKEDLNILLAEATRKELLSDPALAKELLTRLNQESLTKLLEQTTNDFLDTVLLKDAKKAIQTAQEKATIIDVGVTASELDGVPENLTTRITVVSDMRNYKWTQVEEVNGKPVRNLIPE
jgi:hypothetical protein